VYEGVYNKHSTNSVSRETTFFFNITYSANTMLERVDM